MDVRGVYAITHNVNILGVPFLLVISHFFFISLKPSHTLPVLTALQMLRPDCEPHMHTEATGVRNLAFGEYIVYGNRSTL